jgi:SAM-dependent methyltransferase
MMSDEHAFLSSADVDLGLLLSLQERPEPFAPGEPLFWNDSHISEQMLACHLDQDTELASRPRTEIGASVAWICDSLGLHEGARVLDLGCGPGLYATELARRGLHVTGVDYSRRSIDYANAAAVDGGLDLEYHYANYHEFDLGGSWDAVLLIYGEFSVFPPDLRARLLARVRSALKPGGHFVLDVSSSRLARRRMHGANWYVAETGFWKAGPHLVLESGFDYPDHPLLHVDQSVVVEENGAVTVYRNWFQDYIPDMIRSEIAAGDYEIRGTWSDLAGTPWSGDSDWIGIVARKPVD